MSDERKLADQQGRGDEAARDRPGARAGQRAGQRPGGVRIGTDLDAAPDAPAHPSLTEFALRAARSNCTILITGETGVGKGFLANRLHEASLRANQPFIPVNCGAIPESIIDSQLFGHARGSFSGATSEHIGLVRAAENGTLFLDEVGELPASAQTRLLRLLQDREVQPVGHARPIIVDVRIMAATNGDLRRAVQARTFREDLMFRLDVIRINLEPLRSRMNEVPGLLDAFNREFAELYGQSVLEFDSEARARLRSHPWPGNIRQLRTVVERLHVLCPDQHVTTSRLAEIGHGGDLASSRPAERLGGRLAAEFPLSIDSVRYEEVQRILAANGGSVAEAAAVFGVHRSTIYRWLKSRGQQAQPDREPR